MKTIPLLLFPLAPSLLLGGDVSGASFEYRDSGDQELSTRQGRFTARESKLLNPSIVFLHDRVNLLGRNFPFANPAGVAVSVGGKPAVILSVAPRVVTFEAPAGSPGGVVSLTLPGKPSQTLGELRLIGNDQDGDRLPDAAERPLGLSPTDPDSDDDLLGDGLEDSDGDGVNNLIETLRGMNPGSTDSDGDGLADGLELALGLSPVHPDTDGDGWSDDLELDAKSVPSDPHSVPRLFTVGSGGLPAVVVVPAQGSTEGIPLNTTTALVQTWVVASGFGESGPLSTAVARPPVVVRAPAIGPEVSLPFNTTVARPPVTVLRQGQ